jgi:GT2 family glycosyltransferase
MNQIPLETWMQSEFEPGLVSIIVPTYNRATLLPETLDSLVAQRYRPLEVLVVDDGSTDDTLEVIAAWAAAHSDAGLRVHCYSQKNQGAPAARNRGLLESRGEFIQFLDSDDLLDPDKIAYSVEALRADAHLEIVYGPTYYFGAWDGPLHPGTPPTNARSVLEATCARAVWSIMGPIYRRDVCLRVGAWNEDLACWQDREYSLRALARLPKLLYCPMAKTRYRIGHGPNIGEDWSSSVEDLLSIRRGVGIAAATIEAECGLSPIMRRNLAFNLTRVGRFLGILGHTADAQQAFREAAELVSGQRYSRAVLLQRLVIGALGYRFANLLLEARTWMRTSLSRRHTR